MGYIAASLIAVQCEKTPGGVIKRGVRYRAGVPVEGGPQGGVLARGVLMHDEGLWSEARLIFFFSFPRSGRLAARPNA